MTGRVRGRQQNSASDPLPPRPLIPLSAWAAISAIATALPLLEGAWRGYLAGDAGGTVPLSLAVTAGTATLLPAVRLAPIPPRPRRLLLAALIGALASSLGCAAFSYGGAAARETMRGVSLATCTATVEGDPSIGDRGASSTVVLRDASGRVLGRFRMTTPDPYEAGTILQVIGRIEPFEEGGWGRSRFMRGEVGSLDVSHVAKTWEGTRDPITAARARILAAIDPAAGEARALVAGVVCGRTTELARTAAQDDFARTGLSHLVAVSGGHLALIASMLVGALVRGGLRPVARSIVLGVVMTAYVVFTGCSASAVRSVIMVVASMAAGAGGRRGHALSGLSLTVLALVAVSPGVVHDMGFQLSAASVLFIAVLSPYMAWHLVRAGIPRGVGEQLSLTLAAQWATLPITIPVFGELSLISPVANLFAGPLMSALLVAGLVAAPLCAALPALAPAMDAVGALGSVCVFAARAMAAVPYASVAVAKENSLFALLYLLAAIVLIMWRAWPARMVRVAAMLPLVLGAGFIARWTRFAPAGVTVLDVGQADAILIRDGGAAVLVDAGVDDAVLDALARQHVFRLDAIVVTHWDADHWGGAPDIARSMEVCRIIVAEGAAVSAPAELLDAAGIERGDIEEMAAGDVLGVGGFSCRAVWPRAPVSGEENADSLCLAVEYSGDDRSLSMLLTGDTEIDEENAYAAEVGDLDVLKLGHHGSKVSIDGGLLRAWTPELAVASAGEGNSYGHPSSECVEAVRAQGAAFLCTKDVGDVIVEPGGRGVRVRTGR